MEIFFAGSWGTITDSDWTSEDAQAVCRVMGYYRPGKFLVRVAGPVILEPLRQEKSVRSIAPQFYNTTVPFSLPYTNVSR